MIAAAVVGWSGLSIENEVKIARMGTWGSRMSPETHIRANASKLEVTRQYTKWRPKKNRNIPKENEKSKDDVVFPCMKETLYVRRRCARTRECESVRRLNG